MGPPALPSLVAAQAGPTVIPEPPRKPSYTRAYVAIGAGLALTGVSFFLAEEADDAYDRYLEATDPGTIEDEYDTAVLYDRLAGGTLLAGQASILLGLYWRLLKREPKPASSAIPTGIPQLAGPESIEPSPLPEPALRAAVHADVRPLRLGVRLAF